MPIDESLVRSERDRSKLERWQRARGIDLHWFQNILPELVELDLATRRLSREINEHRTILHRLQRTLAPYPREDDPKRQHHLEKDRLLDLEKSRHLKSKIIPSLELRFKEVSEMLESGLWRLGGFVDDKIFEKYRHVIHSPTLYPASCHNPVVFPDFQENFFDYLRPALISYALEFARRIQSSTFHVHHFPHEWRPSKNEAHSMIGCRQQTCFVCSFKEALGADNEDSDDIVTIPSSSLLCLSQLHSGKTYMEKALPMLEACLSPHRASLTSSFWNELPLGSRDSLLPSSQASVHLELLIICSAPVDSLRPVRDYQTHLLNQMVQFYQSLLFEPPHTTTSDQFSLITRTVPPHLLLPCEASRIVVEANLVPPQSTTRIQLGFVSHCLDFASRAARVKSRVRPGDKAEFVYTFHVAWIVDSDDLLKWILRDQVQCDDVVIGHDLEVAAATAYNTTPCVSLGSTSHSKEIQLPSVLIPYISGRFRQHDKDYSESCNENVSAQAMRHTSDSLMSEGSGIVDAPAEASCNPFYFLPLGEARQG